MKERKYQTVVKNQNNFFVVELNIFLYFLYGKQQGN